MTSQGDDKISKELEKEVINLFENTPPGRLKRNLRKIFLLYLIHDKESFPLDFEEMVFDLYCMFNFLDVAENELGCKR